MKRSSALGLVVAAAALGVLGAGWRAAPTADLLGGMGGAAGGPRGGSEPAADHRPAAPGGDARGSGSSSDGPTDGSDGASARALPWLHNFAVSAESATPSASVIDRMSPWRAVDPNCSASAYGGFAIKADVAEPAGSEEVLASYTQGVLVLDGEGRLVASATAPSCQGSADEIEAIAAGDAHIDHPVIAMAVTSGGHRASSTWLVLYRVIGGVVAPVFSAVIEEHAGDRTDAGDVTLLTGALLYHAPSGHQTLWTYSSEQQRYVEVALVTPPGPGA
ncbi:MAG TPA: hypothetical protein VFT22_17845 [Kofleriaceae bacterium]|nr:hypothetical protein [Kofleriaceae bacterium]